MAAARQLPAAHDPGPAAVPHTPPAFDPGDDRHRYHTFSSGTVAYLVHGRAQILEPNDHQAGLSSRLGMEKAFDLDLFARRGYLTTYVVRNLARARYYALAVHEDLLVAMITTWRLAGARHVPAIPHPCYRLGARP